MKTYTFTQSAITGEKFEATINAVSYNVALIKFVRQQRAKFGNSNIVWYGVKVRFE